MTDYFILIGVVVIFILFFKWYGLFSNYEQICKENSQYGNDNFEKNENNFLVIKRVNPLVSILSENVIYQECDCQSFQVILGLFHQKGRYELSRLCGPMGKAFRSWPLKWAQLIVLQLASRGPNPHPGLSGVASQTGD